MTNKYSFTTTISFSIDIEFLADIIYDTTMDYISDNCEVEDLPKEVKMQILKDAAKHILANF